METSAFEERRWARLLEGGSAVETLGGIAAAVLAVVGLANIASHYMVAIASIVLGGGLLVQGGVVAAEYGAILSRFEGGPYSEFGGGLGAEALAGATAVVLGILALFSMNAETLMASAAIVLGGGLVMSSGLVLRLNSVKIDMTQGSTEAKHAAQLAISGAGFIQVFVGLAAMVLGVLALVGVSPMILTLVAMLGIGASTLLSGGSIFGKITSLFYHT